MLIISTEVYDEEKKRKEVETSNTLSELYCNKASEHDLIPNGPSQGDQSIVRIELAQVHTPSRDIMPHGSTQQVGGRMALNRKDTLHLHSLYII
jgi:hypothetical protein